ncbi:heme-copper oxidase subunit III [Hymenobacter caeli]|uniref:Cytochrome c oxidase subunit 3 n=1 Tax=Hymenobacter caeli TaxID=2735894 RepID=A0ABX2FUN2_9BACT|nr:cytochrome c oxidase subunit 3 [Hymenobacter caeli]NRT20893.1 cytochrome c oxidase subunit 3 [Hymenobacter caeli]
MRNSDYDRNKQVGTRPPASAFARIERLPPLLMVLYLALLAVTIMFTILVVLYISTRLASGAPTSPHPFPKYFSLSTIVLLVSSYTVAQAPRLYARDDLATLGRCLLATLLLGAVFAGLQALGWHELQQYAPFRGKASGTYIYLISALHVAHLLGGMLYLLALALRVLHADRDAVRQLVFIRNPYHLRQLRALGTYWHFVDALWVLLFGVFLFFY